MRSRALIVLLVALLSCAKAKAPNSYSDANANKKPAAGLIGERNGYASVNKEAEDLPSALPSLEALIDKDLIALGLPTVMQESQARFEGTKNTSNDNVQVQPKSPAASTPEMAPTSANAGAKTSPPADASKEDPCKRSCDLVTNICDAAERICQITAKYPNDPESPARCTRAQNACESAKKKVNTCPCQG